MLHKRYFSDFVINSVTVALHLKGVMMPIKGSELIQKLQTVVQVSTRDRHRAISEQFGFLVLEDLDRAGLPGLSSTAFDFFRKWRRDDISMRRVRESRDAADDYRGSIALGERDGRESWSRVPIETLTLVFNEHKDEFDSFLSEFNIMKSKATHVSAVFRPFQDKFLEEWERHFDTYPASKIRDEANTIRSEVVGDKFELHIWASSVYDLFRSAAVYSSSFEQVVHATDDPPRQKRLPQGMISSTSERIYGQQWRLWLRENEDQVAKLLSPLREEEPLNSTEAPLARLASAPEVLHKELQISSKEISIAVTLPSAPDLTSNETWIESNYSDVELRRWLDLLEETWALDGDPIQTTIQVQADSKSSSLTLRPMPTFEASAVIDAVIRRLI
tara:strand:+ start:2696 stop:3862 length:1167 start_codon:yes stop_codon:yes gene_type:complete